MAKAETNDGDEEERQRFADRALGFLEDVSARACGRVRSSRSPS